MGVIQEIEKDSKHFAGALGSYVEATPNETQYIFSHIFRQATRLRNPREVHVAGEHGYEPTFVFEKGDTKIRKRIFHPGRGEHITGADYVITKSVRNEFFEIGIQVKRNRGTNFYEFNQRELRQFQRFASSFPNGYYLFVDETRNPPTDCFVRVSEVSRIINSISNRQRNRIRISVNDVAPFCRGYDVFYGAFYSCRRGSRIHPKIFAEKADSYSKESKKVLVELHGMVKKKRSHKK